LSLASANGHVEVVKALVEFGAQVELPDDVRQHCEFVIIMLCSYMLPQNEWGNTPLSRACACGHVETARVLLDHGAYVDHQIKVFKNIFCVHINLKVLTEGYCTIERPISSSLCKLCWYDRVCESAIEIWSSSGPTSKISLVPRLATSYIIILGCTWSNW
jgi:disulfide bond formation protein DsbB